MQTKTKHVNSYASSHDLRDWIGISPPHAIGIFVSFFFFFNYSIEPYARLFTCWLGPSTKWNCGRVFTFWMWIWHICNWVVVFPLAMTGYDCFCSQLFFSVWHWRRKKHETLSQGRDLNRDSCVGRWRKILHMSGPNQVFQKKGAQVFKESTSSPIFSIFLITVSNIISSSKRERDWWPEQLSYLPLYTPQHVMWFREHHFFSVHWKHVREPPHSTTT